MAAASVEITTIIFFVLVINYLLFLIGAFDAGVHCVLVYFGAALWLPYRVHAVTDMSLRLPVPTVYVPLPPRVNGCANNPFLYP